MLLSPRAQPCTEPGAPSAAADIDSNHTVEKNEFKGLITHMASADLWSRQLAETVC